MNFEQERLAYDEIELSVSSIIRSCVKCLKGIILFAILFAIAISSLKYLKDKKEYDVWLQYKDNEVLTVEQNRNVEKYFYLKNTAINLEKYIEKAPIMWFDFSNVYQGELQYYVEAETNISQNIIIAMNNYLNGQAFVEDFCEMLEGYDKDYTKDLFKTNVFDETNSIVAIQVIGASESDCNVYISCIKELVLSKSEELKRTIGEHKVVLIQENTSSGYSNAVYETQKEVRDNLKETYAQLKEHAGYLYEIEKAVIIERDPSSASLCTLIYNEPIFDFKIMILGLLIGVVVAVVIIMIFTIYGGRLQTDRELEKRFGILHIGTINQKKIKKTQQWNIYGSTLKKALHNKGIESISFIGTKDKVTSIQMENICSILKDSNIDCSLLGNVLTQKETIEQLSSNIPVIIVEVVGKSKVKDIYEEVSHCEVLGIEILGYICIME